ncbi:ferrous iron transport protein B [Intestinibacter sp.]|uniref:ferrous iron transport protein B n=1 Tax=Intestinibacter sp. TaxID=1965304 RepID=UPI002A74B22B|nr:ferrous iron transport protein B [Intestinibacter sp.]MDY2735014.1 ferrous iron transport protein B [Intestinibacter sp.]MDY4573592.1 ferrous iron transport protein B [Intestinibacter sp.]
MGLTYKNCKIKSLKDSFNIERKEDSYIVALAGNPNTGKSTVFNYLTGLKQHTGNWPGKTVSTARGEFNYNNINYDLIDLPGTYSLFALSQEEIVARDFICFGDVDAVIVVCDATCLERNLNLVFQVLELTDKVVLCINLIDEAEKKSIKIDRQKLEDLLGIPVVLTSAKNKIGMEELQDKLQQIVLKETSSYKNLIKYDDDIENLVDSFKEELESTFPQINPRWLGLRLLDGDESLFSSLKKYIEGDFSSTLEDIKSKIPQNIDKKKIRDDFSKINYDYASKLFEASVSTKNNKEDFDDKIDSIVTSKHFAIPIMLIMLSVILWITICGANYPSELLSKALFSIEPGMYNFLMNLNLPIWICNMIVFGLYKTFAWVVSVMLPPMAIFFPLFTFLEDLGYLPRIAFNLDHLFKKCKTHGKQCLTMCMGFGCNACGVIGCRIIDSPRERLIAILTNTFMPCNGRFPTLIAISTIFFTSAISNSVLSNISTAICVTLIVLIGVMITLLVSYLLSRTILKGESSTFTLELCPYRVPNIGRIIYTSIIDRTLFVLSRAVVVAIPAGVLTWILANTYIGDATILNHIALFLDPLGRFIGLDGFILLAFILGMPANEIVIPILIMSYMATGSMTDYTSLQELGDLLVSHGWTYLTALNLMLFSLLHWPCTTTLLTIKKETKSTKWTALGFIIPTSIAFLVCSATRILYDIFIFII